MYFGDRGREGPLKKAEVKFDGVVVRPLRMTITDVKTILVKLDDAGKAIDAGDSEKAKKDLSILKNFIFRNMR